MNKQLQYFATSIGEASLQDVDAVINGRIQLFPYGRFYPSDGRVITTDGWVLDDTNGYTLADAINNRAVQLMIDYEHQTLHIKENGRGNPAAGWMINAEYRPFEGLFANVKWTATAHAQIKNKEYRYISPLFLADEKGYVQEVVNAALTNRPALHLLDEAVAFSELNTNPRPFKTQSQGEPMDFKKELLALLGLKAEATDDEATVALAALNAQINSSLIPLNKVYAELATQKAVALSAQTAAQTVDPAKYVSVSAMQTVQTELNQLKEQVAAEKASALIQTALSDGRLLPAQKSWAENLAKTNLTALSDYLATTTPNKALTELQTAGMTNTQKTVALSDVEIATANALGLTAQEYIEHYKQGAK